MLPMFLYLKAGSGPTRDFYWATIGRSRGACTTAGGGECLNGERDAACSLISREEAPETYFSDKNWSEKPDVPIPSKLSDVLESNPDPKYTLSAKACRGILNRAKRRNKELPPLLRDALIRQSREP